MRRWVPSLVLTLALVVAGAGQASARPPTITIPTDQLAGPPLMGLGIEWDPYDTFRPTLSDWARTFQRVDYMRPGYIRVVEPASTYFAGYNSHHDPTYRWTSRHVTQLLTILQYAKRRRITVVLGDWGNPMINGDPRIPAEFLKQLHDTYGFTNIRYYNLINEPNDQPDCDFTCWTSIVTKLSAEFTALGLTRWLQLVGPDNANSWDDTPQAQAVDRTSGLDLDNPLGGDSWVTGTLSSVPGLIGAYDSHRYATIWGIYHGVYGDQMRTRREQIDYFGSPRKRYFESEVGMTARQVSPFGAADGHASALALAATIDPSTVPRAGTFIDSQSHIREFRYGVWMGDMAIQAIAAGVSGASAWDLDDAMHVGGQYGSQDLKQWGFWNSLGGRDGYPASDLELRPWYYAWSVMSRSFPAGSEPLAVPTTGVPGLRIAAAKVRAGDRYRLSFAIVNEWNVPRGITLTVPSARGRTTLTRYDYLRDDRSVDANGFPVPARVLRLVRLSHRIRIRLPGRGLAILSSGPMQLHEATRRLVDELDGWGKVAAHSRGLSFDHANPARFNGDRSRATANGRRTRYIIYHAHHITSFELKAYYRGRLALRVYRSDHGHRWYPVGLESTEPAPALEGDGWCLVDLLARGALSADTRALKIELASRRVELSEVAIAYR